MNKKGQTKVFIIVAIIIILIIGGYFLINNSEDEVNNDVSKSDNFCEQFSNSQETPGSPVGTSEYYKCVVAKGISTKDSSVCGEFSNYLREQCIERIQEETETKPEKTLDSCYKISDTTLQVNCVYDVAYQTNDLTICEDYNFLDDVNRKICISKAVSSIEDLSLCGDGDPFRCGETIAKKTGNADLCSRDVCISSVALTNKNAGICKTESCKNIVQILQHFDLDSESLSGLN